LFEDAVGEIMVCIARLSALLLVSVAVSLGEAHAGSLKEASVTEAVNTVSYQSTPDAPQKSAGVGTTIAPGNIVRTGVKSRAELQFNDNTITRIGANSAFSFDADKQAMNLQEGTALFSKPKDNSTFEITTPAATCSISGTTGFMEVRPGQDKNHASFIFGLIEGHTAVNVGGKTYNVGAGQLLVRTLSGNVNFVAFNIPNFIAHAGLMKDFKSKLPNMADINKAVAKFVSLQARGFIEPTTISVAGTSQLIGFYANAVADFNQYNGINSQLTLAQQVATFQSQAAQMSMQQPMNPNSGGGGFVNVGGEGVIHGQLIWYVPADLDLHLILPGGAGEVYYGNRTITFNGGTATAALDHDNVGGAPDIQPNEYVENITVTGSPSFGAYQFVVHDFSNHGVPDPISYTLTTTGNGGATSTVTTGTVSSTNPVATPVVVYHGAP
jgi:hypothetical protein